MNFTYLYVFLQSNLLEIPFYYLFIKKALTLKDSFVKVTAINSLTHPIVFFVLMNLHQTYLSNILIAESFAIVFETVFFYKFVKIGFFRSFLASTVANLVSWQLAPILTYLVFR